MGPACADGGAAFFLLAMRQPDRFAGYAGQVAPDRLVSADLRPDGQMHVSNLGGQRFTIAYGERDKEVPLRFVERYLDLFRRRTARSHAHYCRHPHSVLRPQRLR